MGSFVHEEETLVDTYEQAPGTRIKRWGLSDDPVRQIEATGELPVMYDWLGTDARTAHPYNVYRDIASQPAALRDTFALNESKVPDLAARLVHDGYEGFLGYGLGTSQFAPMTALGAFWRFARWDARDIGSLELAGHRHPIDTRKLAVFGFSGSGSTVDTVRAAELFRERGAHQIAVVSVDGSPLTQVCDETIVCAGGFDTGGSDTFHYTTRLTLAVWLAIEIGAVRFPEERDWEALRGELFALPDLMESMFDAVSARADVLAHRYRDVRSVFIVGSGSNEGLADEIALKYDEMCHIPAKAMSPGRHLHGALGTTVSDILTIVLAPAGDPNYEALRDVAQVTQMLKAPSIGIVSDSDERVVEQVDDVFRLPVTDPDLYPILAILPGQLLAYFAGVAIPGVNPDTQRSNVARHAKVWHWLFPTDAH